MIHFPKPSDTNHEFAAMPHYHLTPAEVWNYPAEELAEKILTGR
jgi:hypothetical protein